MFELLSVGTWLFWVVFVIFSIIAMATADRDEKGILVIATIVFGVIFGKGIISLVEPKTLAFIIGGYLICGMLWSIIKWWIHVKKVKLDIHLTKLKTLDSSTYYNLSDFERRLNPVLNKGRITTWGLYWPWSMLWSAIHDTVDAAFASLLATYNSIAGSAQSELEEFKRLEQESRKK